MEFRDAKFMHWYLVFYPPRSPIFIPVPPLSRNESDKTRNAGKPGRRKKCFMSPEWSLPQIQPGPWLLRAGLRQRFVGLGCGSLRCRLRDPGPGSARGPRNRVQFARARDRPLSQASNRQRDLRSDVERAGDHHPSAEPVFRAHCHGTFGRQPAPISQRSQNGLYTTTSSR